MERKKVALVTGASSGIGFAIADMLGSLGYGLTVAARRPEKLALAVKALRDKGYEVNDIAANLTSEEEVKAVVAQHRSYFGEQLDVLVNNAGFGMNSPCEQMETKFIDLQIDLNLRAVLLFYRECVGMLKMAGKKHANALVVNLSSIAGKTGHANMATYSATKFAVIGATQSMNKELSTFGVKSIALCPQFVDTPMTDWVKDRVPGEKMIQPSDLAEAVRFVLTLSPMCLVPEIVFCRPGEDNLL